MVVVEMVTETVAREILGEHFDGERFLAESRFDADLAEDVVVRDRFLQCVMAAAWSDEEMAALKEADPSRRTPACAGAAAEEAAAAAWAVVHAEPQAGCWL